MMTNPNPSKEMQRPAMLLYLVSKIVVVIAPLSVLIMVSLAKFGLPLNAISAICATIAAYYASNWYESLSYEVMKYITEKYSDD